MGCPLSWELSLTNAFNSIFYSIVFALLFLYFDQNVTLLMPWAVKIGSIIEVPLIFSFALFTIISFEDYLSRNIFGALLIIHEKILLKFICFKALIKWSVAVLISQAEQTLYWRRMSYPGYWHLKLIEMCKHVLTELEPHWYLTAFFEMFLRELFDKF